MPYGLTNAAESFQRVIWKILPYELRERCCLNFVDDMLIHSTGTKQQHLELVKEVLFYLRKAGLTLKPSKCFFLRKAAKFLGFTVTKEGLHLGKDRIQVISDFPRPTTQKGVLRFLGMCNFVHQFIPFYAHIASPLMELTKQDYKYLSPAKFAKHWTPQVEEAFKMLKVKISTSPVLIAPDYTQAFTIMADASDEALGAVLLQDRGRGLQPVAYASHRFNAVERRWTVTEREMFALFWACRKFESFCKGSKVVLMTDHKPITELRRAKNPCPKVFRWILELSEWDFEIVYVKGAHQYVADALSRMDSRDLIHLKEKPDSFWRSSMPMPLAMLSLRQALQWPIENIKKDQLEDPDWGNYLHDRDLGLDLSKYLNTHNERLKELVRVKDSIVKGSDGLYYKKAKNDERMLLLIPRCQRKLVFDLLHTLPSAGHFGRDKTLEVVARHYWWPSISKDISKLCKFCIDCARAKPDTQLLRQPMVNHEIPSAPFQRVHLDTNTMPCRTNRGNKKVIIFTCALSRWVEAYAVPDEQAQTVLKCLTDFISRHGVMSELITDQGRNFEGHLLKKFCKEFEISKIHTTAYNPQSNGKVERFNRTLNQMLRVVESDSGGNWDLILPQVLFAYRCAIHDATGKSPFEFIYGREPILPGRLILGPESIPEMSEGFTSPLALKLWDETQGKILERRIKVTAQYNKGAKPRSLKSGDLAMLRNHTASKLQDKYSGLYWLVKEDYPHVWRIKDIHTENERVVAARHLRIFKTAEEQLKDEEDDLFQQVATRTASLIEDEGYLSEAEDEISCEDDDWEGTDSRDIGEATTQLSYHSTSRNQARSTTQSVADHVTSQDQQTSRVTRSSSKAKQDQLADATQALQGGQVKPKVNDELPGLRASKVNFAAPVSSASHQMGMQVSSGKAVDTTLRGLTKPIVEADGHSSSNPPAIFLPPRRQLFVPLPSSNSNLGLITSLSNSKSATLDEGMLLGNTLKESSTSGKENSQSGLQEAYSSLKTTNSLVSPSGGIKYFSPTTKESLPAVKNTASLDKAGSKNLQQAKNLRMPVANNNAISLTKPSGVDNQQSKPLKSILKAPKATTTTSKAGLASTPATTGTCEPGANSFKAQESTITSKVGLASTPATTDTQPVAFYSSKVTTTNSKAGLASTPAASGTQVPEISQGMTTTRIEGLESTPATTGTQRPYTESQSVTTTSKAGLASTPATTSTYKTLLQAPRKPQRPPTTPFISDAATTSKAGLASSPATTTSAQRVNSSKEDSANANSSSKKAASPVTSNSSSSIMNTQAENLEPGSIFSKDLSGMLAETSSNAESSISKLNSSKDASLPNKPKALQGPRASTPIAKPAKVFVHNLTQGEIDTIANEIKSNSTLPATNRTRQAPNRYGDGFASPFLWETWRYLRKK